MRTFDFAGTACPVDMPALEVGDSAPDFTLLDADFAEVTLARYHEQRKIVLTVPGVDLAGPADAARSIAALTGAADIDWLLVSRDTPMALQRFADQNTLPAAAMLSGFRNERFGQAYGAEITEGRYTALYATVLFAIDENDTIVHSQFVASLNSQPDLAALAVSLGLEITEAV